MRDRGVTGLTAMRNYGVALGKEEEMRNFAQ